ncbi:hypothetical protein [Streptosporangium sp. NBC_01756]|uniref:hypothetical protein n=1 Tax=Streptosporangium sp. NBC_01756 TaxID=2975950 RepID=UPI002DD91A6E|nr:hypothetical protein [Streptosporangium sp. NBC_01756]WSC87998.1 hypothetical protein OIE48_07235 [Streptosporangium sp. NBC_01756]
MGLGRCEHVDFLRRLVRWSGCQDVSDATVGELSELTRWPDVRSCSLAAEVEPFSFQSAAQIDEAIQQVFALYIQQETAAREYEPGRHSVIEREGPTDWWALLGSNQ